MAGEEKREGRRRGVGGEGSRRLGGEKEKGRGGGEEGEWEGKGEKEEEGGKGKGGEWEGKGRECALNTQEQIHN